jgi:hypothetical protein
MKKNIQKQNLKFWLIDGIPPEASGQNPQVLQGFHNFLMNFSNLSALDSYRNFAG